MSEGRSGYPGRHPEDADFGVFEPSSRFVFGFFCVLLLLGNIFVAAPWTGFHAVLLGCAGLLMLACPPAVALPRLWWIFAALFVLAATAQFLPAAWFPMPGWRRELSALGVQTGSLVVIQSRQAAETLTLFAVMLGTGLWLTGHRPSPSQARFWALAFTLGVAAYAIIARLTQEMPVGGRPVSDAGLFGFFPNRNHTATYLAMGAICGLGCLLQAIRDKRFLAMTVALAGTCVCLWAVAAWSVSRAGIVLAAVGFLAWLPLLGRRYLGKHGVWALALLGLAAAGTFFIADSKVKARLSKTMEIANHVVNPTDPSPAENDKPTVDSAQDLDFRIPTALDTLGMIRQVPWTGIGAGQYRYVFPQYRNLTAVANDSDHFHPESDWLWMAAENGLPSALALAALVLLAFGKSLLEIVGGRDRAIRSACLIAAMLVPFHGLFDVPGHHITLAWSAALLFALSLRMPTDDQPQKIPHAWPFRLAALGLLAAAGLLAYSQWGGGPPPAIVAGDLACTKAMSLYHEDKARQQKAEAAGEKYVPSPTEDLLEQALAKLDDAARMVPLDRQVRHLQGYIGLHFEDLDAKCIQAFAIARALDPTWVRAPMRQAWAWSRTNPEQVETLWREALRRAEWMDLHHPGSIRGRTQILEEIRGAATGHPELEAIRKRICVP